MIILKRTNENGEAEYMASCEIVGDSLHGATFTSNQADAIRMADYKATLVAIYYSRSSRWVKSLELQEVDQ